MNYINCTVRLTLKFNFKSAFNHIYDCAMLGNDNARVELILKLIFLNAEKVDSSACRDLS